LALGGREISTRTDALGWQATVRRGEAGFFTANTEPPVKMSPEFSVRSVAGMPSTRQFFRVHVELDGITTPDSQVWVVCTALPTGNWTPSFCSEPWDEGQLLQVRAALGAALPDAVLGFTIEDRAGFSHLIGDPERAPAIAAAAAVVKYYAAWDESDPIDITINDDQFAVSIGFAETVYRATVRPKH